MNSLQYRKRNLILQSPRLRHLFDEPPDFSRKFSVALTVQDFAQRTPSAYHFLPCLPQYVLAGLGPQITPCKLDSGSLHSIAGTCRLPTLLSTKDSVDLVDPALTAYSTLGGIRRDAQHP